MSRYVCLKMRQIINIIGRQIENNVSKTNVDKGTFNHAKILLFINHQNFEGREIFAKDLEKHFCVTRFSMSKVIALMVKKELLTLEKVDYDARLKKLVLTDSAKELIDVFVPIIDSTESCISQALSEEEVSNLEKYLTKILDYLLKNKKEQGGFLND